MSLQPLLPLVPDTRALLALAEEGLRRVEEDRSDLFATLSTFILVNSLRDWARKERRGASPAECPYNEVIREIANGTKHLSLTAKYHPDPHVEAVSEEGDWDQLDWDDLGREEAQITLLARRFKHDGAQWRTAAGVLIEALHWWRAAVAASGRPRSVPWTTA